MVHVVGSDVGPATILYWQIAILVEFFFSFFGFFFSIIRDFSYSLPTISIAITIGNDRNTSGVSHEH